MGNATPEIACIGYSNTVVRCDTGFSIDTFYVKQMSPLLPLFTPFGRAVRGQGTHKIASVGHSIPGNAKIQYYTDFTIALFP